MKTRALKTEELHIGMTVLVSSLREIVNTYITLVDAVWHDGDVEGKVAFIGSELTPEADRVSEENDNIFAVYHAKDEHEGDVTYDE